jgi:hypothetical protein
MQSRLRTRFPPCCSILSPSDPNDFRKNGIPSTFPIRVNEDDATVTVAAGVPQRMLLVRENCRVGIIDT